jgi:hypothetical protein
MKFLLFLLPFFWSNIFPSYQIGDILHQWQIFKEQNPPWTYDGVKTGM